MDLSKEGPVHDAQWSPTSENFAVCYGFMPAKCTIFDAKKCTATYELGAGPHNTIRWNPFGRFIMLAGFGNLPVIGSFTIDCSTEVQVDGKLSSGVFGNRRVVAVWPEVVDVHGRAEIERR